MPTYEYRCPDGHDFEKFYRKISDAQAELPCPVCGKPAQRQMSGGAGLLFKGSGFYLTDYGKNAHRKSAPSANGSKPAAEKPGEKAGGETAASGSSEGGGSKPAESKPAESTTKPSSTKSES